MYKKSEDVIDFKLDKDIFENDIQYYFTDLCGKYDFVSNLMTKFLKDEFKREFKPIFIVANKLNKFFEKQNFIIVNNELKNLTDKNEVIDIGSEELNPSFSNSDFIKKLLVKLEKNKM